MPRRPIPRRTALRSAPRCSFAALTALAALVTVVVLSTVADASTRTRAKASSPVNATPAARPAATSKAAAEGMVPGAATTRASAEPGPASRLRSGGKGADRTLDAITIEGEIAVPQVLFITSRRQPHYQDLLHRCYLTTSLDVGREVVLPDRVLLKPLGLDAAGAPTGAARP
jgi:hypothetical protein